MKSIGDLGNALATHPYFAPAWVQKLCYYVNSSPCDATDPVFQQIVTDFTNSSYSWNGLVKELLVVAHRDERDRDGDGGPERRGRRGRAARPPLRGAQRAPRLHRRVRPGLALRQGNATTQTIPEIVSGLPVRRLRPRRGRAGASRTSRRSSSAPATENICEAVAQQVIDVPTLEADAGRQAVVERAADAAIADFVSLIMGLTTPDPRAAQATVLLTQHYQSALQQQGITATEALQSTFVAACLSPTAVSIGM